DIGPTVTIQFDGMGDDSEVGLVNMSHRLYDPMTGRFISPDPLVTSATDGQALNRYSFVGNNPLTFVDPTGLQAAEPDPGPDPDLELTEETLMVIQTAAVPDQGGPGADFAIV